jgi:1-acyl-sn-glycerol-3-phosphate acyltransferase
VRPGELNAFWRWGLALLGPVVHVLFRVRVRGLERVPSTGPAIVAFNHVSALDGPVLGIVTARGLRREVRFLVAAEYFRNPIFRWVLHHTDQIPIRRGEGDAGALDAAIETVQRGALAAIAPEGTVDRDAGANGLQRIRSGIARIALPTGAPVVCVGIWGTQQRWRKGGIRWTRPLRPIVAFSFGPPIFPVGDAADPADVDAFLARVREHLEEQVAEARRMTG